jgi:tRNA 2-thiocytidine biosynthesis protein TtcA
VTPLEKNLLSQVVKASQDFSLIEPGDRIMVCMSGGKDSYAMLHLLRLVQRRAPFDLDLVAVNLDQGHPGFPGHLLEDHFKELGVEYRMLSEDTYSIVLEKIPAGKTFCSLCSRLRRGVLYNTAVELGCNKLALGHHRDDLLETLMLNLLYSGSLKTMPPRLRSDDGRNTVIRPLAYCDETRIAALSEQEKFPIIPCDLCGSQENLQRKKVKKLIASLHAENANVRGNMFNALRNVRPSHLLDRSLRELAGLDPSTGEARPHPSSKNPQPEAIQ